MSDFVKELNFDGDTFNDMKRDMNFVLQRLLGNMQEKECQEGTLRRRAHTRSSKEPEHFRKRRESCIRK